MGKFVKAERKRAKARIGLVGPAGSGKTMSALKVARGLVGSQGKIAVIDTEHGSASLYSHLFEYDVLEITSPFTVKKYLEGIKDAEWEGYDVIVIDSLSHAWSGEGGLLEQVDNITASKNRFTAWRHVTPLHNDLVEAMLQSPIHVIATMRAKTEYILVEEKGKQVPKKVGMAPVQREGMDYEFTLVFDIDQGQHMATTSKDRTDMFNGFCDILSEEHGRMIRHWLENGSDITPSPVTQSPQSGQTLVINPDQVEDLRKLIIETSTDEEKFLRYLKVDRITDLPAERFEWAVKSLELKKNTTTGGHQNRIITALAARRIPFKVNEETGDIHASPSYQDSSAKAFLKEQGFKWNSSGKNWIMQAA